MALVQRLINCNFSMANGVFADGGNTASTAGLRTSCRISKWGGPSMGTAEVAIYGLPLSTMNQLSTIGTQYQFVTNRNHLTITAGDADTGMSTIFVGTIMRAWVDAQSMPEVAFRVSALAGGGEAAQPANPTTMQGQADVATLMGQLASQMSLAFENNGVTATLMNPYLWGDLRSQAKELVEAAGLEWIIDCGTLAIWNPGSSRQTSSTPLISPQTGMVGYPAFDSASLVVTSLFNPAIIYGGNIQVKSDLTPACGTWNVVSIDLFLESLVPRGAWFETIVARQTTGSPQEVE